MGGKGSKSKVAPAPEEEKKDEGAGGKFGKKAEHEKDFNGPINTGRKCRDVLCLLLFVAFWVVWIIGTCLAITDGCPDNCNTPFRLLYGYDSEGNMCGGSDIPDSKRMFIGLPIKLTTSRVCVTACPTTFGELVCVDTNGLQTATSPTIEVSGVSTGVPKLCLNYEAPCCYYTYPTVEIMFKCVPDIPNANATSYDSNQYAMGTADGLAAAKDFAMNPSGAFGSAVAELLQYWVVILASIFVALILGFVWLLFLRLFVGVMVWATIIGFLFLLIGLTLLAWEKAGRLELSTSGVSTTRTVADGGTTGVEVDQDTAEVFAWIITVITIVYFFLFCVFIQRIRVAIQVIKEASKAVAAMPFTVLFPLTTFVSIMALAAWWLVGLLYLASAGEFDPKTMSFTYPDTASCVSTLTLDGTITEANATSNCNIYKGNSDRALAAYQTGSYASVTTAADAGTLDSYKSMLPVTLNGDTYNFFLVYHLFGGLWTYAFDVYFGYLVLSGAFAAWYWSKDKKKLGAFPLMDSMKRAIKYHLGSVAFASFIIALIRIIRIIFNYLANRMKRAKDHPVVKILMCLVNCMLKCLERFVNFINKNALIMVAIHGKSFCGSAKDAFSLLLRNALRVAAINIISDVMLTLGKLFVCVGTVFAGWSYFQSIKNDPTLLPESLQPSAGAADSTPIFPLLIIAALGFFVGTAFMGVFECAIDTIFLSFCEDLERNDGSKEKPYYMSDSLKHIASVKNKEEAKKKGKDDTDDA